MKVLSVCQVNSYIKMLMNKDELLSNISVRGEISNFKNHASGHLYFTLKDGTSVIKCLMFKNATNTLKFEPKDGMKVVISGNVTVFERDGQYQLYCYHMEADGIGVLYQEFEKLKKKLQEEGLFAEENKKKLPLLPKRVGVLTSGTGAVIRDIINVSLRRFKEANIVLFPVAVQGVNSAKEVANGIELFNKLNNVDVIIAARGGGSLEELWSFNEEIVARAIFASKIPIVSAVGHETDFTIADMVADLRAPTPSAAAELIFPTLKDLQWRIITYKNKIDNLVRNQINSWDLKLKRLTQIINLYSPENTIKQYGLLIQNNTNHLCKNYKMLLEKKRSLLIEKIAKLNSLNPLAILERGFTLVTDENGKGVNSVLDIGINEVIQLQFKDGQAYCEVKELNIDLRGE